MLTFEALTPEAQPLVKPYLLALNDRLCDLTPGAVLMWHKFYRTEYAIWQDNLFFRVWYGAKPAYTLPMGDNVPGAFQKLLDFTAGQDLVLSPVSENGLAFLRETGEPICVKSQRNWFDYLYNAADLRELAGKKYHGQRGHANRFRKTYPDWSFSPASVGDIPVISAFLIRYFEANPSKDNVAAEEQAQTARIFTDPSFAGMLTGVLRIGEEIAGVSAGEIVGDTLFVHIEKALTGFTGVYPAIVQSFAQAYTDEKTLFINREEDVGVEGLRQSKMSYHPVRLLEKYLVHWGREDT